MDELLFVIYTTIVIFCSITHCVYSAHCTAAKYDELDFVQIAQLDGYKATKHKVTTEDGYILSLFRITGADCSKSGTPILLMHGLLQTADSWLDPGRNVSLAYLLADDCYDLWVGNNRGTYYGREHTTLNPDTDDKFWEFSMDQIGQYDLAAQIDHVLDETGSRKLNYIGFSQGGGTFLMLCSTRVEYNEKVNVFIGLAPATRLYNVDSFLAKFAADIGAIVLSLCPHKGHAQELFGKGSILKDIVQALCELKNKAQLCNSLEITPCSTLIDVIDAPHKNSITDETLAKLYAHVPAGLSITMVKHYDQLIHSQTFDSYGKPGIPYPLEKVSVKSVILNGHNDHLVTPLDIKWLGNQLPNVVMMKTNKDIMWNHVDNGYNKDLKTKLYPTVRDCLINYGQ